MKTKFKTKKLAALFLTLVLALGLLPMSTFVDAAISNASTASITVQNAVKGDTLAAYKLINITYDATTNALTYEWNSDFKDYFEQTNGITNSAESAYTVEQFAALADDSEELKTLLSGLPRYINNQSIAAVGNQTVTETGTEPGNKTYKATFSGLKMGEYFIRPTLSTSVYQLMLQKIEPTVSNGTYEIDDVTLDAKHKEVAITKTANKTSVTKGEKVNYNITVDIPTYDTGAADKYFSVTDNWNRDGFTIDNNSITAVIQDNTGATKTTLNIKESSYWDFSIHVDNSGFDFDVDKIMDTTHPEVPTIIGHQYDNLWKNYAGDKLVITYDAIFDANFNDENQALDYNATIDDNTYTNEAVFTYSQYPYVYTNYPSEYGSKSASVDVSTFAIKIDKFDKETSTKLAGATFSLYRSLYDGEEADETLYVKTIDEQDGTIRTDSVSVKLLETSKESNSDGIITFEKYEANGTKYNYYLVETKAPSGYNLLEEPQKVNFSDDDVATTNGIYTVEVPNSRGIVLPTTGGTGTVIFTVIGISLMIGAVVLFVVSKKKVETE